MPREAKRLLLPLLVVTSVRGFAPSTRAIFLVCSHVASAKGIHPQECSDTARPEHTRAMPQAGPPRLHVGLPVAAIERAVGTGQAMLSQNRARPPCCSRTAVQ